MTKEQFIAGQRSATRRILATVLGSCLLCHLVLQVLVRSLESTIRSYGDLLRILVHSDNAAEAIAGATFGLSIAAVVALVFFVPVMMSLRRWQLRCSACGKPLSWQAAADTGRCCYCQKQVFTHAERSRRTAQPIAPEGRLPAGRSEA